MDFTPLDKISIVHNSSSERLYPDIYTSELVFEQELPGDMGQTREINAHSGELYLADQYSIFRFSDNEFELFLTPGKGYGPAEVSSIFRFDIIPDSAIAITSYTDSRVLFFDLVDDTTYTIDTQYAGEVKLLNSVTALVENSGSQEKKMFQVIHKDGTVKSGTGEIFRNQDKSLSGFTMWTDADSQTRTVVAGFLYAGYYVALDQTGHVNYITENILFPGRLPQLVSNNDYQYIETGNRSVTSSLSVSGGKIFTLSSLLGNDKKEPIGSVIDIYNFDSGAYQHSFKLDRALDFFDTVYLNEDTLRIYGVTLDHQLAIWELSKPK